MLSVIMVSVKIVSFIVESVIMHSVAIAIVKHNVTLLYFTSLKTIIDVYATLFM
jgi:hypothetical protein